MKPQILANSVLAAAIVAGPVAAHYFTGRTEPGAGIGFGLVFYGSSGVLLFCLSLALFMIVNLYFPTAGKRLNVSAIAVNAGLAIFLACVTHIILFIALTQVHLALGGVI